MSGRCWRGRGREIAIWEEVFCGCRRDINRRAVAGRGLSFMGENTSAIFIEFNVKNLKRAEWCMGQSLCSWALDI
jgi:hypothetical protein